MRTYLCSRAGALRRYALPLITATAVFATLVPAAPAMAERPAAAAEDEVYPPPPGPGDLSAYPEIASIMRDANEALRYSMAVVAADTSREYPAGSIEADLREGLLSMPAERQRIAAEAAQAMISDPDVRLRQFGRHGELGPERYAELGFSGVITPEAVPFNREALKRGLTERATAIEAVHVQEELVAMETAKKYKIPKLIQIPTLTSLDYRIEQVRCADETNPEWPGDDEIAMGGTSVDHKGMARQIGQFGVYNDFDDGEVKVYSYPGKLFERFDLTKSGAWPRTYSTVVMLAEKDGSGFADAISLVWSKVQLAVLKVIEKAVAGVLTGYLGAALADAIGKAVAWVVGAFFDWLIEMFHDDLFHPGKSYAYLPNRYEWMYKHPSDYGWTNFRSPTGTFTFNGHGGSYQVNIHWEVNP